MLYNFMPNWFILVFFLATMQLSISYLKHSDKKRPGRMISPNPRILVSIQPAISIQGNCNFRGRSIPLATVTITSLEQTQYISQMNKVQRIGTTNLKDFIPPYFIAFMVRKRPKMLFSSQCFESTQSRAIRSASRGDRMYCDTFVSKFHILGLIFSLTSIAEKSQRTNACILAPPQNTVRMIKAISIRVQTVIFYEFVIKQYSPSKTRQPIKGYCTISQI